jgi:hypothetical protein
MIVLALAAAMAAEPQPCLPRAAAEVEAALTAAEVGWGVDLDGFRAAVQNADAILACAVEPISPALAARMHRAHGLRAYADRDTAKASAAFAASRRLDPEYSFPAAMVPAGNPVRTLYDSAVAEPGSAAVDPPARGATWFDGAASTRRPAGATVFQRVEDARRAHDGAWVAPGAPLPRYALRGQGLRGPLLVGAGVGAAAAIGLYAWALHEEDQAYTETYESLDALDRQVGKTNAIAGAGVGLGVVSLAAGTVGVVYGRW